MSSRKQMTSAIDGMSVAEVRRALQTIRKCWQKNGQRDPFYSCIGIDIAANKSMHMEDFALRNIIGHKNKRDAK